MTTWPLLESVRERLGVSLSQDSIAPLFDRPAEVLQILRLAAESAESQIEFSAAVGVTRPYVGTNSGSLLRTAFVGDRAPFERYLSGIGSDLILFPEIAINDPVTGILRNNEWSAEGLSSIAPALLHLLMVLAPLVDHGYVHVISLTREKENEMEAPIYHELYKAVFGGSSALSMGIHRRQLHELAEAIAIATFFPTQLQVYLTSRGFSLYERAIKSSSSSVSSQIMLAPPRVRLKVPAPDSVTISDILRIRETGQVDRWMSGLDQAVAGYAQLFADGVSDSELVSFVQERLRVGYEDLQHAAERIKFRSSAQVGMREITIGLMAALPGLYWSPEVYAQAAAGSVGLAIVDVARTILNSTTKRINDVPLLRHYEAFFTST